MSFDHLLSYDLYILLAPLCKVAAKLFKFRLVRRRRRRRRRQHSCSFFGMTVTTYNKKDLIESLKGHLLRSKGQHCALFAF